MDMILTISDFYSIGMVVKNAHGVRAGVFLRMHWQTHAEMEGEEMTRLLSIYPEPKVDWEGVGPFPLDDLYMFDDDIPEFLSPNDERVDPEVLRKFDEL